jgi:hypothetical protein
VEFACKGKNMYTDRSKLSISLGGGKYMKKYSLILVLIAAIAVPAAAQSKAKSDNPCESAAAKFCPTADNFRDFLKCLDENKKSLSAACRSRVAFAVQIGKKFKDKKTACKADTEKLCGKATEDKGKFKCLLRNKSKCSAACQKDLDDWRRAMSIAPSNLKEKVKERVKAPPKTK